MLRSLSNGFGRVCKYADAWALDNDRLTVQRLERHMA